MKVPYRWVQEFVDLDLPPEQAADRLVNAGIEVASVTPVAPPALRGVVVGEIEAIERELGDSHGHRLVLCRVSTGGERFTVVCGAPNTKVGVRAAFAPPGATLPGGRVVTAARIRGVDSHGMLCSERELGLGDEHEAGLLVLDAGAPLGADLVEHLGLDDHVLEIEITPNRPDALSVIGVARELAALTGAPFRPPSVLLKESGPPASDLARVRIDDPDLCRRFTARVISDIAIGPSPAWLAARLRAVGLRPISNVVDVTNYVMWETGQPLHAFDHAQVSEATIVVRRARPGERIRTLDGQERALDPSMLLITDPARAVAVAGVMGGENSEVSADTRRVLLEVAYFDPGSIRRTSRALGLRSDAAYRFERGADIDGIPAASARAAQLIQATAGGTVAPGLVDVYPRPRAAVHVRLRMDRVRRLIGVAPPRAEAHRILTGLGLLAREEGDALDVEVPSFRRDLAMEDDLVEEVIRVWGYDRIPTVLEARPTALVRLPVSLEQAQALRRALTGAGLAEVVTYSFSDPGLGDALGASAPPVDLLNPLSQDAARMRRHPLEGVLGAVAVNLRRQQPDVAVFELCKTYVAGGREPRWAAVALTGRRAGGGWLDGGPAVDVYDAKGLVEHALDALGVREWAARATEVPGLEHDRAGVLRAGGVDVAWFGEVGQAAAAQLGLKVPVFAAMVALDELAQLPLTPPRYEPLPRFPSVQRDMAFAVGEATVAAAEIEATILEEAGPLLREVRVFDVFRLPDGGRSVGFRLTFQAEDRTLTDDEVNAIRARVADRVCARHSITLRGT